MIRLSRRSLLAGAAALIAAAPARAQVATAPFTLLNGKMFVTVSVNGQPAEAFVDSGSSFTGVDTAFAKKAGLRLGLPMLMQGIQGFAGARAVSNVKFEIGAASVTGDAVALNYSKLAGQVHHPIDAVVGGDIFRRYVVEIDFDSQTLSLHDPALFQPPADAQYLPLQAGGELMTTLVSVEDNPPIRAVVDLGNNTPLIVSPSVATRLGLLANRPISNARMGGQGPSSIAQVVTARSLTLAGERLDNVPVLIPERSIGYDANLGLPVLERFRLYLDFGHSRMWLGKASAERDEPFLRDRTGLEADVVGDTLRVAHIAKGSPAATGPWRVGDVITQINGEPAASANLSLSLSAQPGQQITFTLADGSQRSLTLADYY